MSLTDDEEFEILHAREELARWNDQYGRALILRQILNAYHVTGAGPVRTYNTQLDMHAKLRGAMP